MLFVFGVLPCGRCQDQCAVGWTSLSRICGGSLIEVFGCSAIGATIGWRIHTILREVVVRYVIGVMIGTALAVARMSQLRCNAAKSGLSVFGGICLKSFAEALRRFFVIGWSGDVDGEVNDAQ